MSPRNPGVPSDKEVCSRSAFPRLPERFGAFWPPSCSGNLGGIVSLFFSLLSLVLEVSEVSESIGQSGFPVRGLPIQLSEALGAEDPARTFSTVIP